MHPRDESRGNAGAEKQCQPPEDPRGLPRAGSCSHVAARPSDAEWRRPACVDLAHLTKDKQKANVDVVELSLLLKDILPRITGSMNR